MLHRRRVPQVQQVPVVLDHPLPVPLQERLVRQVLRRRAAHPDHLRLQPETGPHPAFLDVLEHPSETTVGEPRGGGLPFPDAVPPGPAVVVPAGVDAEHLGAGLGGGVDQRQQLGRGRVTPQGVHVIVENQRISGIPGLHPDQIPPVPGQFGQGALISRGADRDRDRDGDERLTRFQAGGPGVVQVVGTGHHQRQRPGAGGPRVEFPVPGPVVLDLPGPGPTGRGVLENAGG